MHWNTMADARCVSVRQHPTTTDTDRFALSETGEIIKVNTFEKVSSTLT